MNSSDSVDVICMNSMDGSVVPLRIRVQDDEGIKNIYKIKSYKELTPDTLQLPNEVYVTPNILRFECKVEVFGTIQKIQLHYNKSQTTWSVFF